MTAQLIRRLIDEGRSGNHTALTWVMAKTTGELTLDNIQKLYTAGDTDTRWLILTAAQYVQLPALAPLLRQVVREERDKALVAAAIEALAAIRDETLADEIKALIETGEDASLRGAALSAWETITGKAYSRRSADQASAKSQRLAVNRVDAGDNRQNGKLS